MFPNEVIEFFKEIAMKTIEAREEVKQVRTASEVGTERGWESYRKG